MFKKKKKKPEYTAEDWPEGVNKKERMQRKNAVTDLHFVAKQLQ